MKTIEQIWDNCFGEGDFDNTCFDQRHNVEKCFNEYAKQVCTEYAKWVCMTRPEVSVENFLDYLNNNQNNHNVKD